ncbi:hypothetical protein H2204_012669 [Knufia peltigerae]|uniref:Uncharacterized protein n=1 Tax=Knufia peltigerae TaxID=1002370 RepID=A0AA38XRU9_9EURO|nr:hypothetical protein H2204_012669 [Knufia peltigerae]
MPLQDFQNRQRPSASYGFNSLPDFYLFQPASDPLAEMGTDKRYSHRLGLCGFRQVSQETTGNSLLPPIFCTLCCSKPSLSYECQSRSCTGDSRYKDYERSADLQREQTTAAIADQESDHDTAWDVQHLHACVEILPDFLQNVTAAVGHEQFDKWSSAPTPSPIVTDDLTLEQMFDLLDSSLPLPIAPLSQVVKCPSCDYQCASEGPSFK